jgi:hypothetical protein
MIYTDKLIKTSVTNVPKKKKKSVSKTKITKGIYNSNPFEYSTTSSSIVSNKAASVIKTLK